MAEAGVTPHARDSGRFRVAVARGDGTADVWAHAALDADGQVWVFIEGETIVVPPPASRRAPRHHAADDMTAPMPATVREVLVAPGDHVSAGQTVVLLEAMKMELPIKAPRDGQVASVGCEAGSLVPAGTPLVQLVEDPT